MELTQGQRFHAGFELFETVRRRMLAGIRSEFPAFAEFEVEAEFRHRLRKQREQQGHAADSQLASIYHESLVRAADAGRSTSDLGQKPALHCMKRECSFSSLHFC